MNETEKHIRSLQPVKLITGKQINNLQLSNEEFSQLHFTDCHFSYLTLDRVQAQQLHFHRCTFSAISLNRSLLNTCTFHECEIATIMLKESGLLNISFQQTNLRLLMTENCQAERCLASACTISDSVWKNVNLSYWSANDCEITGWFMQEGQLQDSNWFGCTMAKCHFTTTAITRLVAGNSTLTDGDFAGNTCDIMVWQECRLNRTDMREINLSSAGFAKSRLEQCRLDNSNLNYAQFNQGSLHDCSLTGAQLTCAQFTDAGLHQCDLSRAILTSANFVRASLNNCILDDTGLTRTDMRFCQLKNTHLHTALVQKTRLHGAETGLINQGQNTDEPLLTAIDLWYARHQPGIKDTAGFSRSTPGASRYV